MPSRQIPPGANVEKGDQMPPHSISHFISAKSAGHFLTVEPTNLQRSTRY
jgi:hypothetical protein